MATPIRNIPTLKGKDAVSFYNAAAFVEANPGTVKVLKKDIKTVRRVLRELNANNANAR